MKLFEVVIDHHTENKVETSVQYVTAEDDSMKAVVDYFTIHCEQFEESLKSVREVAAIVQHIRED